jgi:hypothetical protein
VHLHHETHTVHKAILVAYGKKIVVLAAIDLMCRFGSMFGVLGATRSPAGSNHIRNDDHSFPMRIVQNILRVDRGDGYDNRFIRIVRLVIS